MPTIRRTQETTGRNDLCPCGSGRKFKRCCQRAARKVRPHYRSFQLCYSEYQRVYERRFIRQWGVTPTPSILAAYIDGDTQTVDQWLRDKLTKAGCLDAFVIGVIAIQRLATPDNLQLWTELEKKTYASELSQYCPPTNVEMAR